MFSPGTALAGIVIVPATRSAGGVSEMSTGCAEAPTSLRVLAVLVDGVAAVGDHDDVIVARQAGGDVERRLLVVALVRGQAARVRDVTQVDVRSAESKSVSSER